jgi:hypothetical protein
MEAPWATLLYWLATIQAGLIVVLTVASYFINASKGEPSIEVVALLLAGAIWLIGWSCRRIFAE